MRKRRANQKMPAVKHKHPGRWLLTGILFLWLTLAALWYVEDRIEPILDELAEYEAQAIVATAVHTAIEAAGREDVALYTGLYQVEYAADGSVQAVHTDAAALNRTRVELLNMINQTLQSLPEQKIEVAFGTLSGFSLLNGIGPGWVFTLQPEAYADGIVEEYTETVAINSTRYTAVLALQITINMVLDGQNRLLYVNSQVPLANILVDGETPVYYGSGH